VPQEELTARIDLQAVGSSGLPLLSNLSLRWHLDITACLCTRVAASPQLWHTSYPPRSVLCPGPVTMAHGVNLTRGLL